MKWPPFRQPLNRHVMLLEPGVGSPQVFGGPLRGSVSGGQVVWCGCVSASGAASIACGASVLKPVVPGIVFRCLRAGFLPVRCG
jgi:hypothetical protein